MKPDDRERFDVQISAIPCSILSFFAGFFLCAGVSNGMWGLKDELPDCQLLESYLETGF